ncbi:hypothetical protein L3Y34_019330 [Caenorhabditis briggsae]|uniref:Uncharacterized protein n=1 Tax=Caenorhabditis briggsae TaxID=6238 RepID=A0AAE9DMK3_CAEBR|nr:hypothetical protein L3Y34_019330 [Caenorhabditis briggsae]
MNTETNAKFFQAKVTTTIKNRFGVLQDLKKCRSVVEVNDELHSGHKSEDSGPSPHQSYLCKSAEEYEKWAAYLDCVSKDKGVTEKPMLVDQRSTDKPSPSSSACDPSASSPAARPPSSLSPVSPIASLTSPSSSFHPPPAPKSNDASRSSENLYLPSLSSSSDSGSSTFSSASPLSFASLSAQSSSSGYGSTQPNQRKRGAENQTRGQGRKRQLIQSTHSFDRVQKTHEAHKIYHHRNLFKPRKDPVLDSNNPVFEDWPVPHGVELPPGSAPGIKMPVRAPTIIKQVILDETDHSGSVVVERRDRS